jgi:hypothetical protein
MNATGAVLHKTITTAHCHQQTALEKLYPHLGEVPILFLIKSSKHNAMIQYVLKTA